MKRERNNKGFTLVELIVVMAIMAILVGALAPQVIKYVEKARESKDLQIENTLFTAVQTAIASSEVTVSSYNDTFDGMDATLKTSINGLLSADMLSSANIINKCKSKKATAEGNEVYVTYDSATGYLGVYIAADKAADVTLGTSTLTVISSAVHKAAAIGEASNQ